MANAASALLTPQTRIPDRIHLPTNKTRPTLAQLYHWGSAALYLRPVYFLRYSLELSIIIIIMHPPLVPRRPYLPSAGLFTLKHPPGNPRVLLQVCLHPAIGSGVQQEICCNYSIQ